jgi:uncharacterized protein (DUF1800 family)
LKSPAEVVVGTLRLMGGYEIPKPGYRYMGQDLLNPPSVEGWHTGQEWINSGSLMSRANFVAEQVGNTTGVFRASIPALPLSTIASPVELQLLTGGVRP